METIGDLIISLEDKKYDRWVNALHKVKNLRKSRFNDPYWDSKLFKDFYKKAKRCFDLGLHISHEDLRHRIDYIHSNALFVFPQKALIAKDS